MIYMNKKQSYIRKNKNNLLLKDQYWYQFPLRTLPEKANVQLQAWINAFRVAVSGRDDFFAISDANQLVALRTFLMTGTSSLKRTSESLTAIITDPVYPLHVPRIRRKILC